MADKERARPSRVWVKANGFHIRLNGKYYQIEKGNSQYEAMVATALTAVSMGAELQVNYGTGRKISTLAIMGLS